MISPSKVKLFKYVPGKSPKDILNDYKLGLILPWETYDVLENFPSDLRRLTFDSIAGTDSYIPDINKVSYELYNYTSADFVVSKIRYTNLSEKHDFELGRAYIGYKSGYIELAVFINQSPELSNRVVLMVLEDSQGGILTDTTEVNPIQESLMKSSGNKVVRIILQTDSINKYLQPYSRLFSDVDLGILEVTTNNLKFSKTPINSVRIREEIQNKLTNPSSESLSVFGDKIGTKDDTFNYDYKWQ